MERDFEQIYYPPLIEDTTWSLKKISPAVLEDKSFKGVDGRRRTTTSGRTTDVKWSQ